MHPAISINTLCLAPAPFEAQAETVAALGAKGITPEISQVLDEGVGAVSRALRAAGLTVAALTHRSFGFATAAEAATQQKRLLQSIAIAGEIGAANILMTTGGRGSRSWGEAAARFGEAIAPCAEAARSAGVTLGIEPTSHLYADVSIIHRAADTVALARRAAIAPMPDLFACWADADIEAALGEAARLSPLVQIADYVYGDRGLPCRAVPGDGAVPFDRLIPALVAGGFRGWYDLEIIGPRLPAEGERAGLARAGAYIGGLIEAAGGQR
jgi:sugar phosphate isomerase/epimerase